MVKIILKSIRRAIDDKINGLDKIEIGINEIHYLSNYFVYFDKLIAPNLKFLSIKNRKKVFDIFVDYNNEMEFLKDKLSGDFTKYPYKTENLVKIAKEIDSFLKAK